MSALYAWRSFDSAEARLWFLVAKALVAVGLGYWARHKGYRFSTFFLAAFFLDPIACAAVLAVVPEVRDAVGYSVACVEEG
ncbi:hypothetical protein [Adlercreutzia aquisgranensis]|uniref:hypothetical protein n=1 Tax=Adlercreutzia aquisgranensis TaxID=2941323 RepID=UPI00203E1735|nr:hypothetical protein [Adlercreutzia aquisgranensis]